MEQMGALLRLLILAVLVIVAGALPAIAQETTRKGLTVEFKPRKLSWLDSHVLGFEQESPQRLLIWHVLSGQLKSHHGASLACIDRSSRRVLLSFDRSQVSQAAVSAAIIDVKEATGIDPEVVSDRFRAHHFGCVDRSSLRFDVAMGATKKHLHPNDGMLVQRNDDVVQFSANGAEMGLVTRHFLLAGVQNVPWLGRYYLAPNLHHGRIYIDETKTWERLNEAGRRGFCIRGILWKPPAGAPSGVEPVRHICHPVLSKTVSTWLTRDKLVYQVVSGLMSSGDPIIDLVMLRRDGNAELLLRGNLGISYTELPIADDGCAVAVDLQIGGQSGATRLADGDKYEIHAFRICSN